MKKRIIFKGVGTALVTPFRRGAIDYTALDGLIERQIQGGIDALIIGGTTGEAAVLSDSERYSLFEFCREKNFALCNLLEGRELSEELQSNIQLFGKIMLSCLEYFEDEKILSDEEKKPYTTESAKEKIALLKEILEV